MLVIFEPGDRFELNEISGNAGRKGFVLRHDQNSPDNVLVRFDGFAYNSQTRADYMRYLPSEAFRPNIPWTHECTDECTPGNCVIKRAAEFGYTPEVS